MSVELPSTPHEPSVAQPAFSLDARPETDLRVGRLAARIREAWAALDCEQQPWVNVAAMAQATNAFGVRFDEVHARHNKPVDTWEVWAIAGTSVVRAVSAQLESAWTDFSTKTERMGRCRDCNAVYDGAHIHPTCLGCEMRSLLPNAPVECAICHETTDKAYTLSCGHRHCRVCLKRWKQSTCPECRVPYVLQDGWVGAQRCSCETDDD